MSVVPRLALVLVGCVATSLAIAGALLPGLPTTPFLLVALWAFGRSSRALYDWLQRMPLLGGALAEAYRFERKRSVRASVKVTALSVAWGSVAVTAATTGARNPLLSVVAMAAAGGTLFMWWVPTERR